MIDKKASPQTPMSLPAAIISKVLSYLVNDTRDLAGFRFIAKEITISSILQNGIAPMNCCFGNGRKEFISELCRHESDVCAGSRWHFRDRDSIPIFQGCRLISCLILEESDGKVIRQGERKADFDHRDICRRMVKANSVKELSELESIATQNGTFTPVEIKSALRSRDHYDEDDLYKVILTLEVPNNTPCASRDGDSILLKASFLKEGEFLLKPPRHQCDSTYFAVVVETREETNSSIVLLPIYLMMDIECGFFDNGATDELLEINDLWDSHQTKPIMEGVAIVDSIIPPGLHQQLLAQIDEYASSTGVDYHPHSNEVVRDIVHPALYPYIKGKSPIETQKEIVPPCCFPSSAEIRAEKVGSSEDFRAQDYWGRPYEESALYQWLPTYFDVDKNGSCVICDYINNLVPRDRFSDLYHSLQQLFSLALPLLESVYSYSRAVKPLIRDVDEEMDYFENAIKPFDIKAVSLKDQRLQVITKIVDYELGPGQSYDGVWHVEGMSHEEIVATALFVVERDDELDGGNLLFKRAFYKDEADEIYSSIPQSRPAQIETLVEDGLLPLGQVSTLSNRLVVFPNSHVHKVTKLVNVLGEPEQKGNDEKEHNTDGKRSKRRIVVFFLVNPEKRLISTREVAIQQDSYGGILTRNDALEHRLNLMRERKFTKQDWNVREIELCEH